MSTTALERAWDRDDNEERRYLREGPRLYVAWCWLWTSWSFGCGGHFNRPSDTERWGIWAAFGPVSTEVFWEAKR